MALNKEKRLEILSIFEALMPNPSTELNYTSDFELLVAVILSAQAKDTEVNKATAKLYPVANTPQAIFELGVAGLTEYIKTIGLFNSKAKNIIATCQILLDKYDGKVPQDRDLLMELPGVGQKTANVVMNEVFGGAFMPVDTHVFRVLNRIGFLKGKTVAEVETKCYKLIPKDKLHKAHHWFILHGRYICKARKPECQNCPIYNLCAFKEKTPIK